MEERDEEKKLKKNSGLELYTYFHQGLIRIIAQNEQDIKAINSMSLPKTIVQHPFTLAHGSPRNSQEHILFVDIAHLNLSYFETPYCFVGHTMHNALFQEALTSGQHCEQDTPRWPDSLLHYNEPIQLGSRRMIVNPGSVGYDKGGYDGVSYYGIYDNSANTFTFKYHTLEEKVFHDYKQKLAQVKREEIGIC